MADASRRAILGGLGAGAAMTWFGGRARAAVPALPDTVFDFSLPSLDGGTLDFGTLRGRALLVVNTASFCGFTPQYAGLQKLHEQFEPQGLTVVGVPSNDFWQESKDAAKVKEFCDAQFGITFPMTTPEAVTGRNATPLFRFLAEHAGGPPRWNFYKYLVSRDGKSVESFSSMVGPESASLVEAVHLALKA